jgi:hypothetical protein
MPQEGKVYLSGLFPGLDPSQLDQPEENLRQYLGVISRISKASQGCSERGSGAVKCPPADAQIQMLKSNQLNRLVVISQGSQRRNRKKEYDRKGQGLQNTYRETFRH